MEFFSRCELTDAGALILAPGEVQLCLAGQVTLSPAKDRKRSAPSSQLNGTLYVTTHRVVWIGVPSSRDGLCVEHSSFGRIGAPADIIRPPVQDVSNLLAQRLLFALGDGVRVEFAAQCAARADKDRVYGCISRALAAKHWEVPPSQSLRQRQRQQLAHSGLRPSQTVGMSGALNVQRYISEENGKQITSGFSSLDSLMSSADVLVQLSHRLKVLSIDPTATSVDNDLLNMMADIGIESPVTKDASGNNRSLYCMELARQLSDFLRDPIVKIGGVMTLTDAYCLVNRARATVELVSPDDFVAALGLLSNPFIASRLSLQTLDNGVRALQVDMSNETSDFFDLVTLVSQRTSVTALEIVRERRITLQVALQMLNSAELSGLLVRDETVSGLRFFVNRFFVCT
jgi:EAP30/Vps36 family